MYKYLTSDTTKYHSTRVLNDYGLYVDRSIKGVGDTVVQGHILLMKRKCYLRCVVWQYTTRLQVSSRHCCET